MSTLDPRAPTPPIDWGKFTPQVNGLPEVLADLSIERLRQDRLWGEQNHEPATWLAILGEEFGEVAKEVAESRINPLGDMAYRTELIHVAAVAVAAIEALDRALA